jgi:phage-related baseplate assembly protein
MSGESNSSDLSTLPPPDVLQPVNYESVLAEMRNDLVELAPELADVLSVESEPITKLLEIMAYWRIHDRQMVNDAVKSNLLSFAGGGDLDQLASFYDVARLTGETDEPFRNRLQTNIRGWSPGSVDYYRFHALSVDPTIQGAYAASPESGLIRVAVLFAGETDEILLMSVRDRLTNPAVRLLTDRVEVVAAILIPVSVQAKIWLRPDAPPGVMDAINTGFPELFNKSRSLGWNLAKSWIIASMHIPGVKRVELTTPSNDINVASDQCVELAGIEISANGVEW